MKKIVLTLALSILFANISFASLNSEEINVFNLKKSNMYLLDVNKKIKDIEIADKKIVNISPITSLSSKDQQLFVEANDNGVCDVLIKTTSKKYKARFIVGQMFEDNKEGLTQIDFPSTGVKVK